MSSANMTFLHPENWCPQPGGFFLKALRGAQAPAPSPTYCSAVHPKGHQWLDPACRAGDGMVLPCSQWPNLGILSRIQKAFGLFWLWPMPTNAVRLMSTAGLPSFLKCTLVPSMYDYWELLSKDPSGEGAEKQRALAPAPRMLGPQ